MPEKEKLRLTISQRIQSVDSSSSLGQHEDVACICQYFQKKTQPNARTVEKFESYSNGLTFLNILIEEIPFKKSTQRKDDFAVGSFCQRVEEVCFDNMVQLFGEDDLSLAIKYF